MQKEGKVENTLPSSIRTLDGLELRNIQLTCGSRILDFPDFCAIGVGITDMNGDGITNMAVSYTHLTLPTIYSV